MVLQNVDPVSGILLLAVWREVRANRRRVQRLEAEEMSA
jgi:hypothetical protein